MSEVNFIKGQPITVTQSYNQLEQGTNAEIAALDKINGQYQAVLKNDNGIIGAIPVDFIQAL